MAAELTGVHVVWALPSMIMQLSFRTKIQPPMSEAIEKPHNLHSKCEPTHGTFFFVDRKHIVILQNSRHGSTLALWRTNDRWLAPRQSGSSVLPGGGSKDGAAEERPCNRWH